jgi:hypothetical protein
VLVVIAYDQPLRPQSPASIMPASLFFASSMLTRILIDRPQPNNSMHASGCTSSELLVAQPTGLFEDLGAAFTTAPTFSRGVGDRINDDQPALAISGLRSQQKDDPHGPLSPQTSLAVHSTSPSHWLRGLDDAGRRLPLRTACPESKIYSV